jgi:hypothetical protein
VVSDPPGTRWLKDKKRKARRDNPEDMFNSQQNYARNKVWAKPGTYNTQLTPQQEQAFREWVQRNRVDFNPADPTPDYDMRGYWLAQQQGNPLAQSSVDPNDQQLHYPDYWKTPYDATFSDQSQWGIPGQTPSWQGDRYTMPGGHVIYDDQAGKWYGLPNAQNPPGSQGSNGVLQGTR